MHKLFIPELMSSALPHRYNPVLRLALIMGLAWVLLVSAGCDALLGRAVKQRVGVPPLLAPLSAATTEQLISEVNQFTTVQSIRGKVDIQFEDTSFAEEGISEKYSTADGTIVLQRPGQVYLTIQLPIVGSDVAQMTSDGSRFRVAVIRGSEKYRRFIVGSNDVIYPPLQTEELPDEGNTRRRSEVRTVSALSSLRPQHLTEALLLRSIDGSGYSYAISEIFQPEEDTRPRARTGARVVRGYYLLDELDVQASGKARLLRRFWFDRVGGIRLARLQTFAVDGSLVTDVVFRNVRTFGSAGRVSLPARVELTRPQDRYKLSITYQTPESVVLDRQYDQGLFVLENKWQLPEVDLDTRTSPTSNRP